MISAPEAEGVARLDLELQRDIARPSFDDAGDADEIDPLGKLNAPMIGESERMRTLRSGRAVKAPPSAPAAAQMAETETVMAVDQDARDGGMGLGPMSRGLYLRSHGV